MNENKLARESESGQSLVEFGISVVVILMLLVGLTDFGRALFTYIALRDAAQEGAVYGSICPLDASAIEAHARKASNYPVDLSNSTVVSVACVYMDGSGVCGGSVPQPGVGIKVTVSFPDFQITTPMLGSIMGTQTLHLSAEASDTILRNGICQ